MAASMTGRGLMFLRRLTDNCMLSRLSGLSASTLPLQAASCFHTSSSLEVLKNWDRKNLQKFPPQAPEEPRRAAEVHHCRRQIKYSMDKMWYLSKLIKGMSVDQAVAQLEFNDKKGAKIMKEVILEAQDLAVRNHNVEYKSNLYVADSYARKGKYLKRIRYHGRGMCGVMDKVYCHYFVRLVEGAPPVAEQRTGFQQAQEYVQGLRKRTVIHSL